MGFRGAAFRVVERFLFQGGKGVWFALAVVLVVAVVEYEGR